MKIEKDKVVSIHFTVKDDEGTEIDTTYPDQPLAFIQGTGLLVEALETALYGLEPGDKQSISLEEDEAYGPRYEQLLQTMPINMFEGMDVEVGMQFRATTDEGEQTVIVVGVQEDSVTVDGNHPLAGIPLTFDIEVLEVREPTDQELAHGHIAMQGAEDHLH